MRRVISSRCSAARPQRGRSCPAGGPSPTKCAWSWRAIGRSSRMPPTVFVIRELEAARIVLAHFMEHESLFMEN
jgi:hypothetical protein